MSVDLTEREPSVRRQAEVDDPRRWWTLATVMIGTFMAPLDGSITNIALPVLRDYFVTTISSVEWVTLAYLLTVTTLLLTFGRLGDFIGHKRIYVLGFGVFLVGSIFCGLAESLTQLIAFRAFQALGAGMVMAVGPAIITRAFPAAERGRALGINALSVAAGLAVGPILGGFLITSYGWRWIFFINVPFAALAIVAASLLLHKVRGQSRRFDFSGAITGAVALWALLLALSKGQDWGWISSSILSLALFSAAFFLIFVLIELKRREPMLDFSLFRNHLFLAANTSAFISFIAIFSVIFLMPFLLLDGQNLNASQAGWVLVSFPVMMGLSAPLSGRLSDRIGSRFLCSLGMLLVALALFFLGFAGDQPPIWVSALLLAGVGLGSGIFQAPNNSAIMGAVEKRRLGLASGMLATMRNSGMVFGVAISGAVMTARLGLSTHYGDLSSTASGAANLVGAIQDTFLVIGAIALLGVLTSAVRGSDRPKRRVDALPVDEAS